jgi:hypothetical protein
VITHSRMVRRWLCLVVLPGCGGSHAGPNLPEPTDQPSVGGSPSADAAARADLWPRILRFLARE